MSTRDRRQVVYLHHTRDKDGDVILYFVDRPHTGEQVMQSSPVTAIRRLSSAVIDLEGHGAMAKYLISTAHTDYEVQMAKDKADHLATEVGGTIPGPPAQEGSG
jgi:hypothetical protein